MLVSKDKIAKLIPHAGTMCLLDGVLYWDASVIRCFTTSHRSVENPLFSDGCLHAVCGIEYAAQAMAVHGRLAGDVKERPQIGYLASVRELICHVDRLDTLPGDLFVEAEQLLGDARRVIYQFKLRSEDAVVLSGRAAVVLLAGTA